MANFPRWNVAGGSVGFESPGGYVSARMATWAMSPIDARSPTT